MRDIIAIQGGNRRAAVLAHDAEVYGALIDLLAKVKGAGWAEATYKRAEDVVTLIEKQATGVDNVKVKAA